MTTFQLSLIIKSIVSEMRKNINVKEILIDMNNNVKICKINSKVFAHSHVKSLAVIESFWVFNSGLNSSMNNISKIRQSYNTQQSGGTLRNKVYWRLIWQTSPFSVLKECRPKLDCLIFRCYEFIKEFNPELNTQGSILNSWL